MHYPAHNFVQASSSESLPKEGKESNNLKRSSKTSEAIYYAVEEVNLAELNEMEDDTAIPSELLGPKYQAGEHASEAAKHKSLQAMEQVPLDRLVKLRGIRSRNIKDGGNVEDDARFQELVGDRVNRAADYTVSAMHIKTTKRMNKKVYQVEVIDRISQLGRFQLQNTIDPSHAPVYKEMSKNCTELGGTTVLYMDKAIYTHSYVKYLSSKRPFFKSPDFYLKQIQNVLTESSIQALSEVQKGTAQEEKEDPSVQSRDDMQRGANYSTLDSATMV